MCAVTLALAVSAVACPVLPLDPVSETAQVRRLSNPELSRIRGTGGFVVSADRHRVARLVQDSNFRDMTLASPAMTQVIDNWSAQVGAAMIAFGLSRP